MLVSQIMKRDFPAVPPTASIQEAAKKMKDRHIGMVLVLEEDHVKGIVTERELTKAMTTNRDASNAAQPAAEADPNRCCYFSDVQVDLLLSA
jgi:CBS domain-containing protein